MTVSDTTSDDINSLRNQLITRSEKVQQKLIPQLANLGNGGLDVLMEFLLQRRENTATPVDGKVYQILHNSDLPRIQEFLQNYFPQGILALKSERHIDYTPLEKLLTVQDWEAADRMTIAGSANTNFFITVSWRKRKVIGMGSKTYHTKSVRIQFPERRGRTRSSRS